ncbi:MAG TPA: ABC transporter substrate-binding protein [Bradyrhizobium sp.]|jgi:putative ABC transport system substrate-binding protein|nr:ABC transporter substrate-binding protein [Bradyrhizobium sp.]
MRRREFITLFGGTTVAWPLAVLAQQPKMPVVGFLNGGSPDGYAPYVTGFLHGLNETGYSEGKNVTMDYQWARGQYDRLKEMAADLVRRKVAVIAANTPTAPVAKAATAEIPIVFVNTGDPVVAGLVASFNRPGGNVTGVSLLGPELETKRLELLDQLIPGTKPIGVLVNPMNPAADIQLRKLREAAGMMKRQIDIVRASTPPDIEMAFKIVAQNGADGLLVVQDPFYNSRRDQIVALAARYEWPVVYPLREFADIGGLVSYGHDLVDGYRQMGVYVGRILKGEKPADLPVVQPTKFEFVINLKTAKTLGLTVPPSLLTTANEVIE